jgi:hypothetical protein
LVIDDAGELLARGDAGGDLQENTIYVTAEPAEEAAAGLADVRVVLGAAGRHEAWFHRAERDPCLVTFEPGVTRKREIRPEVGRLLRRA